MADVMAHRSALAQCKAVPEAGQEVVCPHVKTVAHTPKVVHGTVQHKAGNIFKGGKSTHILEVQKKDEVG